MKKRKNVSYMCCGIETRSENSKFQHLQIKPLLQAQSPSAHQALASVTVSLFLAFSLSRMSVALAFDAGFVI